jgi:hypothetical protein
MPSSDRRQEKSIRIFISYRRSDSPAHAGRLYDALASHFGNESVFMDVSAIEPGADFIKVLVDKAASCNVLIAVIGKQWLSVADRQGRRRLDDPDDWVRREISAALDREVRVIPTVVDNASMPQAEELPRALAALARRQMLEISDKHFHRDVDDLIERLMGVETRELRPRQRPQPPKRPAAANNALGWRKFLLLYRPTDASGWIFRILIVVLLVVDFVLVGLFSDYSEDKLYWLMLIVFSGLTIVFWRAALRFDTRAALKRV